VKGFSLEQFMLKAWYGCHGWLLLLRPLSFLYRTGAVRRRQRYLAGLAKHWHPPVPLIVVGNITLGGTGKTPMVIWLVDHLRQQGRRVGVISRGYGASPPSLPWLIDPGSDVPEQVGDEPLLIARRCSVPVVVDPVRSRAARFLLDEQTVDVIVSDDGLQHYAMGRTLELVMIDHRRGLGNARCLPEGPLREPVERLATVDFVIRNGADADGENSYAMRLAPAALINVLSGEICAVANWVGGREVNAVAGIGNPQRFFETLESLSFVPKKYAFPDHARYNAASFSGFDPAMPVIMTEKDAVKCCGFAEPNWWYLSVEASMSEAFVQRFDAALSAAK